MSLAHLTLPTRDVERTTRFFEQAFGFQRISIPANVPMETQWLDVGRGQAFHIVYVEGFAVSPFESEFGRHIALFYPLPDFPALKERLTRDGAELVDQLREVPFERFFFREPTNGYFFEVIDDRQGRFS